MTNNKQQNAVGLLIEEAHKEWGEYKKTMTNNKQQTAVEQLAETLRFTNKEVYAEIYDDIQEAKEMEKAQIISAHNANFNYDKWPSSLPTLGDQYYNETYGEL
jgi:ribosomal protein S24E